MTESFPNEFTREQASGIQALALANQTMDKAWALLRKAGDNDTPEQMVTWVLDAARQYRHFINEDLRSP